MEEPSNRAHNCLKACEGLECVADKLQESVREAATTTNMRDGWGRRGLIRAGMHTQTGKERELNLTSYK